MPATSGRTLPPPFAYYDPASASLRTSQDTFDWDSTPCSPTLPRSGSMRNGWLYERPTSGPRTSASGSFSSPGLPTPTARGYKGDGYRGQLPNALSLLPTPAAADGKRGPDFTRAARASSGGDDLVTHVARLLPTPRATDTGTPGRRASEGWRPPLSQVVLPLMPTPRASDGEKGGPNQRGSKGDLTISSAAARIGAGTPPPSPGGKRRRDAPPPGQLTIEDASPPPSSSG